MTDRVQEGDMEYCERNELTNFHSIVNETFQFFHSLFHETMYFVSVKHTLNN